MSFAKPLNERLNKVRWGLIIIATACTSLLVILTWGMPVRDLVERLVTALVPMLVIAYLILTFQEEMEREIFSRIVFRALLGDHITPEVVEVFRREVGDNALVRKTSEWRYDFKVLDDRVLLAQTIKGKLINVSTQPRQHRTPQPDSSEKYVSFKTYEFKSDLERAASVYYYPNKKPDDVIEVGPLQECEEVLRLDASYSIDHVFDEHHTGIFISALTITFTYPSGMILEFFPHFSCKPDLRSVVELNGEFTEKTWTVTTVLPQQGLSFRLRRAPTV